MKTHHTLAHNESIAGVEVECSVCGTSFRKQRTHAEAAERHFCDDVCKAEGYKNRVTLTCDYCDKEFERRQSKASDSGRVFCSNECQAASKKARDNPTVVTATCDVCGDSFKRRKNALERYDGTYCSDDCKGVDYSIEREIVECANCGNSVKRYPSVVERYEEHYCSDSCRWDNFTGMNHPQWSGGESLRMAFRRGLDGCRWDVVRGRIRQERPAECQLCGRRHDSPEQHLQLHHIIPIMAGGSHHPDNLMFLCAGCHRTVESFTRDVLNHVVADLIVQFSE